MGTIFGSKGDRFNSLGDTTYHDKENGKSESFYDIGGTTYGSSGKTKYNIGGTSYINKPGGGNVTVNKIGGTYYTSEGKNYYKLGNTLYSSDGDSWCGVDSDDDIEDVIFGDTDF